MDTIVKQLVGIIESGLRNVYNSDYADEHSESIVIYMKSVIKGEIICPRLGKEIVPFYNQTIKLLNSPKFSRLRGNKLWEKITCKLFEMQRNTNMSDELSSEIFEMRRFLEGQGLDFDPQITFEAIIIQACEKHLLGPNAPIGPRALRLSNPYETQNFSHRNVDVYKGPIANNYFSVDEQIKHDIETAIAFRLINNINETEYGELRQFILCSLATELCTLFPDTSYTTDYERIFKELTQNSVEPFALDLGLQFYMRTLRRALAVSSNPGRIVNEFFSPDDLGLIQNTITLPMWINSVNLNLNLLTLMQKITSFTHVRDVELANPFYERARLMGWWFVPLIIPKHRESHADIAFVRDHHARGITFSFKQMTETVQKLQKLSNCENIRKMMYYT